MVCRLFLCSTPCHERPLWDFHHTRQRSYIHSVNQTKIKHKKHNRSRNSGHWWLNCTDTMDETFLIIPRNIHTYYNNLLGQQSMIMPPKNGRTSSCRRTKHLDVRYFFVTYKIIKGEVKLMFCPTNDMLAELFCKTTTEHTNHTN